MHKIHGTVDEFQRCQLLTIGARKTVREHPVRVSSALYSLLEFCLLFTTEGARHMCLENVLRAPIVESWQRWNSFGARTTSGRVVRRPIKKLPYV